MRRPMSGACLMFVLHVRGVNTTVASALAGSLLVPSFQWASATQDSQGDESTEHTENIGKESGRGYFWGVECDKITLFIDVMDVLYYDTVFCVSFYGF